MTRRRSSAAATVSIQAEPGQAQHDIYLVRCGIFAKPDVSIYAEDDVLERQFRYGLIGLGDLLSECLDKGVPVLQRTTELGIAH